MENKKLKILYYASYFVLVLGALGLPVLHLIDIKASDGAVVPVGVCELPAAPVLVRSSMGLWQKKKK